MYVAAILPTVNAAALIGFPWFSLWSYASAVASIFHLFAPFMRGLFESDVY